MCNVSLLHMNNEKRNKNQQIFIITSSATILYPTALGILSENLPSQSRLQRYGLF